jgi:hypothetical protein
MRGIYYEICKTVKNEIKDLTIQDWILLNSYFLLIFGDLILTYLLRGLSPQANYTDRATAACRRS